MDAVLTSHRGCSQVLFLGTLSCHVHSIGGVQSGVGATLGHKGRAFAVVDMLKMFLLLVVRRHHVSEH
jgi:hypothetical protein